MIRRLLDAIAGRPRAKKPAARSSFRSGDLVSVATEDGGFGVIKVLAVDEGGVHARLYVQRFDRRPRANDLGELSVAPFGEAHPNPLSIGHMPLSHASFTGWEPELVARGAAVEERELEGYRMWQEAEGGYF